MAASTAAAGGRVPLIKGACVYDVAIGAVAKRLSTVEIARPSGLTCNCVDVTWGEAVAVLPAKWPPVPVIGDGKCLAALTASARALWDWTALAPVCVVASRLAGILSITAGSGNCVRAAVNRLRLARRPSTWWSSVSSMGVTVLTNHLIQIRAVYCDSRAAIALEQF